MELRRTFDSVQQSCPQAFIDTPQVIYSDWNRTDESDHPLGILSESLEICLIGGGIANAVAAFELAKAGAQVTLLESTTEVGGRARSVEFPDRKNVAEMGAMRFPPSQDLLYYYAEKFGYCFQQDFPDPGIVPTIVSFRGNTHHWIDPQEIPPGFKKVYHGWVTFISQGLHKNGSQNLESLLTLRQMLQSPDPAVRHLVIPPWQLYLDTFRHDTFLSAIKRLFGRESEWDIPGGQVWDEEDFERFAALGLGSGGFGPVYDRSFNYLCRLVVNGLLDKQATFSRSTGGKIYPTAFQNLVKDICAAAIAQGAKVKLGVHGEVCSKTVDLASNMSVIKVKESVGDIIEYHEYNVVIIAATTRAMNMSIPLLTHFGTAGTQFLSSDVCAALNSISMISSSKVFIRTKKFWKDQDNTFPRVILSDTKAPQLYTLDYGDEEFGMVLVTYAWGELSTQLMAITDKKQLLGLLKDQIANIMQYSSYPTYAEYLAPVSTEDILVIHWQLDPTSFGAFTLARPGQEPKIADAFYAFKKNLHIEELNAIYISGDSITFEGGWVEGALRSAMNVVSAILEKYGTLSHSRRNKAPVHLLKPDTYKY